MIFLGVLNLGEVGGITDDLGATWKVEIEGSGVSDHLGYGLRWLELEKVW